jgi:hypothetical protein
MHRLHMRNFEPPDAPPLAPGRNDVFRSSMPPTLPPRRAKKQVLRAGALCPDFRGGPAPRTGGVSAARIHVAHTTHTKSRRDPASLVSRRDLARREIAFRHGGGGGREDTGALLAALRLQPIAGALVPRTLRDGFPAPLRCGCPATSRLPAPGLCIKRTRAKCGHPRRQAREIFALSRKEWRPK